MSKIIATIAGDSGDGVQLLGRLFSDQVAKLKFYYQTLPDFPAEIRAPAGTVTGVSGFQIQWGSDEVLTAGHRPDVLIAFNAAALKKYLSELKPSGIILYDPMGFDLKNFKKSQWSELEFNAIPQEKIPVLFSKVAHEGLTEYNLTSKEKDQNKNLVALGFLMFGLGSDLKNSIELIQNSFKSKPIIAESMIKSLKDGYHLAETAEFTAIRQTPDDHRPQNGYYKNVSGNKAIALALLAAPKVFGKKLIFAGYPITPASEILQELSKFQFDEIIVEQTEDEIAAAGIALGAGFSGQIGVTASSGPGFLLKQETISLALMAEIPMVIIDVQRAGPSTGMPTKTEQSDLELALYGRHGESPVPIVAIPSPETAFETIHDAIKISLLYQTPVIVLSDALVANSSQLWEIPQLEKIDLNLYLQQDNPYQRNNQGIRSAIDLSKPDNAPIIVGGLEKNIDTGQISYDPINHEKMIALRKHKVDIITSSIAPAFLEKLSSKSGTLLLSWGSTYGTVYQSFINLKNKNHQLELAHIHLTWILPFPDNFLSLIQSYSKIIVIELNSGQLARYLKTFTNIPLVQINKIQGLPFYVDELQPEIEDELKKN